jgi:hypothetical protein
MAGPYKWKDIANVLYVELDSTVYTNYTAWVRVDIWSSPPVYMCVRLYNHTDGVMVGQSEEVYGSNAIAAYFPALLSSGVKTYGLQAGMRLTDNTPNVDFFVAGQGIVGQ